MGRRESSGFTLIEILTVVFIIMLLATVSVLVFKNINKDSALRVSAEEVHTALLDARNRTLGSRDDTVYGVHIDATEVILFNGTPYNPADPTNSAQTFFGGIMATTSLSGGVAEIVFERLTGLPTATGTISLYTKEHDATTTLTIYDTGLVE